MHVTQHWDAARSKYEPFEDQDPETFNKKNGLKVDIKAVQPNAYALYATKSLMAANYSQTDPELYQNLLRVGREAPDVVVLTEGWGGVPYCSYFKEMKPIFEANPKTAFVWAPIYVTNHDRERYECFKAETNNFEPGIANLKMLDFWDISKGLGTGVVHTAIGGPHMKAAIGRLKQGWCDMKHIYMH